MILCNCLVTGIFFTISNSIAMQHQSALHEAKGGLICQENVFPPSNLAAARVMGLPKSAFVLYLVFALKPKP
jgi:hypothetical protein